VVQDRKGHGAMRKRHGPRWQAQSESRNAST
jgi:hypothetical protein